MLSPNNAKRKPEYLRVVFFSLKLFFVDVSALSGSIDYLPVDCRAIELLVLHFSCFIRFLVLLDS